MPTYKDVTYYKKYAILKEKGSEGTWYLVYNPLKDKKRHLLDDFESLKAAKSAIDRGTLKSYY